MANRSFKPGSQLQIFRQFWGLIPFYHHGIYVDDHEVIEYGGGNLLDLSATKVRKTTLLSFEDGGNAEVVTHPTKWKGITYSPYLPPDETIDRARWLVDNQPPTYWVAHRNCEYIANWCATGDFESFQTKRLIGAKAMALDLPLLFALRKLSSRNAKLLATASGVITLASAVPYIHDWTLANHLRTYPGIRRWQ